MIHSWSNVHSFTMPEQLHNYPNFCYTPPNASHTGHSVFLQLCFYKKKWHPARIPGYLQKLTWNYIHSIHLPQDMKFPFQKWLNNTNFGCVTTFKKLITAFSLAVLLEPWPLPQLWIINVLVFHGRAGKTSLTERKMPGLKEVQLILLSGSGLASPLLHCKYHEPQCCFPQAPLEWPETIPFCCFNIQEYRFKYTMFVCSYNFVLESLHQSDT